MLLLAAAIVGPWLVPHDGIALDPTRALAPPGTNHWLGTDRFGRDPLARILLGGRLSLGAAVLVLLGTLAISLTMGLVAGLTGRVVDAVLMRTVDVVLALVVASWAYDARARA